MTSNDADQAAAALGRAIERGKGTIEREWLERVERDVVDDPDLKLTHLRNAIPDYLAALARLLCDTAAAKLGKNMSGTWATVAREHGVTRVLIGFDISQLVHEFGVLRQVIREVTWAELAEHRPAEAILADCIEAAIAVSVQAYVDARDLETRRTQAESIGFLIHELRNPLGTASFALARLRSSVPEPQPALDVIERACKELNRLIDGVLSTERLEAGHAESAPEPIPLGPLLEPALDLARAKAAQKGLRFAAEYDRTLRVWVDPALTRSALQNVADNAVKYTDAGTVSISAEDAGEHVVVHVRDDCHGLSKEELRTIFEPFKRGRTRKSGTGLGLAIARRAIEAQGGTIGAESPGARGCHFWITLPKSAPAARTEGPA